jgi:predicted nucleic acid-binding protein
LKRPLPEIKAFVDTSVLIAGLASVSGTSAAVLDLCETRIVRMIVSRQVLIEADRNLAARLPALVPRYRRFMKRLAPFLVDDPTPKEVERAARVVNRKDAPILAVALIGRADFLITLDKKHFLGPQPRPQAGVPVVSPAEFLRAFEALWLED